MGVEAAWHDQTTVSVAPENQTRGVVDNTPRSTSVDAYVDASTQSTVSAAASDADDSAIVSRVANADAYSPVSMLKYIDVCITF